MDGLVASLSGLAPSPLEPRADLFISHVLRVNILELPR
jgi:hypothetical protein